MEQVYLSADKRTRIQDLIRDRKITQAKLAEMSGVSESIISRYLQGKTQNLGDGNIIKLAKALQVSTDFLLGETNIPDRKNYDIDELGLSAKTATLLYTGKVDVTILNQMIEHPHFPLLLQYLARYQNETMRTGIKSMNQFLIYSDSLLLEHGKAHPEDASAAKIAGSDVLSLRTSDADILIIQNIFMQIVRDIKKANSTNENAELQKGITAETMKNLRLNMQKGSESINLRNITENDMAEHIVNVIASAGIPENLLIELKTVLAKIMKYVKDMGNDQRISINEQ